MKLTKQGLRDLDSIPSKPKGIKLDMPPRNQFCKHKNKKILNNGDTICLDCDKLWDWNGNEW